MTGSSDFQKLRAHFSALEAEQGVIGRLLLDNSLMPSLAHLAELHFQEPAHGRIWTTILDLTKRGRTADCMSVALALRQDIGLQDLNQSAGGDYLRSMTKVAPFPSVALSMAEIVLDEAARRAVVEGAAMVTALATDNATVPGVDLVARLRTVVEDLEAEHCAAASEFVTATDAAAAVVAQLAENTRSGKVRGKRTGLKCIDYRCGGLHSGALIVVAGRPGMGKTALARAIAHGAAVHSPSDQVLFLGMEMSPGEMMERELSAISYDIDPAAAVEYRDMGRGLLSAYDMAAVSAAQQRVPANLILRDCAALSLDDVRRLIWAIKRKGPLSLVVIDYLGLMRKPDGRGRNEASLVGDITMGLKQLARQAKCTIVLLSQLNRQVEARDDKRPMLSDLRESGSIEQDGDFVLFPFRPVYYLERSKPSKGKEADHDMELARLQTVMEVICAKARRGAVGTDWQVYRAEYDHISDEVRT